MKLTYKQKLEVAKWIARYNNGLITGSIMLRERGIELGREPQDIDILIEDTLPEDIILPPLCEDVDIVIGEEDYPVLKRAYFFGTKIEFIQVPYTPRLYAKEKLADIEDLLQAKRKYLETDTNEAYLEKTKRDIEIIEEYLKNKEEL